MAQGPEVLALPPGGSTLMPKLTSLKAEEIEEIRECEKLLRFRDQVLSGSHPRIKPPHLAVKAKDDASLDAPFNATTIPASQAENSTAYANGDYRQVMANSPSYQANQQTPTLNMARRMPGLGLLPGATNGTMHGPAASKPPGSGKPEIDPILLSKSDNLVRAELQLQRQRLERSLRDQVDQKRASERALLQASELVADLDISDVLSKALALSQATVAQSTDDTAANASASSDLFDDNTFYSSQHDTPEPYPNSRSPAETEDEPMREGSPYEPELDPEPIRQEEAAETPRQAPPTQTFERPQANRQALVNPPSFLHVAPSRNAIITVPGLGSGTINSLAGSGSAASVEAASSASSGKATRSGGSGSSAKEQTALSSTVRQSNQGSSGQSFIVEGPPLIRAHDLSPIAPQPAHVSPLAVARRAAVVQQEANARRPTPAQIVALRNEPSGASSPDSSPQGNKAPERKKSRKKKRKAERLAAETVVISPRIKTEPHSPSPISATPLGRPSKRQRQQQQQAGLNHDGSRYDQSITVDDGYPQHYEPRNLRDERIPRAYERGDEFGPRPATEAANVVPRYQADYYGDRLPPAGTFRTQPVPAVTYPPPQQGSDGLRAARTVSHAFAEQPYRDAGPAHRDPPGIFRMSMRPGGDQDRSRSPTIYERSAAVMPPPRAQPTRIVVDEFGREYVEPPRPATVFREPIMSGVGAGGPDTLYERQPLPQSVPRRADMFDEDRFVYRSSPAFAAPPRRVVTQPGYPVPDFRSYRERDYIVHPMGPPSEEYIPVRVHAEGREINDMPREHVLRAASARPPADAPRYDVPGGFERRPVEERGRDYMLARAASVRPAEPVRYEMPIGYERRVVDMSEPVRDFPSARAASVRPPEAVRYSEMPVPREYGTRVGSVRPELPAHEYPSVHPDARRELMPPPDTRTHSIRHLDAPPQPVRHDYWDRPPEHHGRPPVHDEQEMVYVNRMPAQAYH